MLDLGLISADDSTVGRIATSRNGDRTPIAIVVCLSVALSGCVFITRSSVSSSEAQAQGVSGAASVSGDGRFVAFESDATNLVSGDTNGVIDVFVRDHQTGDTERVSVGSSATQASGESRHPSISDDGRYVTFFSSVTNLATGDTNGVVDVFLHDRTTGATERISVDSAEAQADGGSFESSISSDGRYVAFDSEATNLVSGDTNDVADVFVRDRTTGVTERVSVDSSGTQADFGGAVQSISDDGNLVAFHSGATNLVSGDTNGSLDVFVHDRTTGDTERASVDSSGAQANGDSGFPSISGDGGFVAFQSSASNLVTGDTNGVFDIFVHDRTTGITQRVSVHSSGAQADANSLGPSPISDDGRYVTFESAATNLVSGDTNFTDDVFVRDRTTGITQRVSLRRFYQQANGQSFEPSISGDGRYVAFQSVATNLLQSDTNGLQDVFLKFALAPRPLGATGNTSIARGTTGQITITGSWFDPNILQVSANPGAGVSIDSISVGSPNTSALLTITVAADAETGSRDLLVTNPGNSWNLSGAGGSDICTGCLTITGVPTLFLDDPSVVEGDGGSTGVTTFTVTLEPADQDETVVVQFETQDGTAVFLPVPERDYQATAGTLRFSPGETTKTVDVAIAGDDRPESDEDFTLNLFNPGGALPPGETTAVLGKPVGTATIIDDD